MIFQMCRHGKIQLKYLAHLQYFILTSRIYDNAFFFPPSSASSYISNTSYLNNIIYSLIENSH